MCFIVSVVTVTIVIAIPVFVALRWNITGADFYDTRGFKKQKKKKLIMHKRKLQLVRSTEVQILHKRAMVKRVI